MTISIEQYRISIANYIPVSFKPYKGKQSQKSPRYSYFLVILILLTLIPRHYTQSDNTHQYQHHNTLDITDEYHDKLIDNGNCKTKNGLNSFIFIYNVRKNNDKSFKSTNGNIKNVNKINLMQYNKGNSSYSTKDHLLNHIISNHNMDIVCVSEANLTESYITDNNLISGFSCKTKPMSDTVDLSRNIILINDRISYTRRLDLENQYIATIWLEIKTGYNKSILVMGGYRQWRLDKR